MRNQDIRDAKGNLSWADIAEKVGISDSTLFYHLRRNMNEGTKKKIMAAIEELKKQPTV